MSRVEKRNSKYKMAYGLDHLVGIFIQIFDLSKANDDDEGLVVDKDEWTDPSLSVERIVEIASEYGFHIADELSEKEIRYD